MLDKIEKRLAALDDPERMVLFWALTINGFIFHVVLALIFGGAFIITLVGIELFIFCSAIIYSILLKDL